MSNFFHTSLHLICHHNIQELAFLSPWPCSSVGFGSPQGLLLFALKPCWKLSLLENIPVSRWLAIVTISHSSQPLLLVFTPLPWHSHTTPCLQRSWESCTIPSSSASLGGWKRHTQSPRRGGHTPFSPLKPSGGQVQVLQNPLVRQTPLRSHTAYQNGFFFSSWHFSVP